MDPVKPTKLVRPPTDILPQALPALPPSIQHVPTIADSDIKTPCNTFGLWRRFFSKTLPSHDPEEHATLENLSDIEPSAPSHNREISFSPYPNESSFLLGEWYWDDSIQKSHKNFDRLVKIVGHPDFRPEDVRHTKWKSIDAQLAGTTYHKADEDEEWLDAGWETKEIKVSVPFPKCAAQPGPREYTVGTLYYCPIVNVIREKFSNPHNSQHYHYEPFELFWDQEGFPSTR